MSVDSASTVDSLPENPLERYLVYYVQDLNEQLWGHCLSSARPNRAFPYDPIANFKREQEFLQSFATNARYTYRQSKTPGSQACYYHPRVPSDVVVFVPQELSDHTEIRERIAAATKKSADETHRKLIETYDTEILSSASAWVLNYLTERNRFAIGTQMAEGSSFEIVRDLPEALTEPALQHTAVNHIEMEVQRTAYIPDDFSVDAIDKAQVDAYVAGQIPGIIIERTRRSEVLQTLSEFLLRRLDVQAVTAAVLGEMTTQIAHVHSGVKSGFSDGDRNPFVRSLSSCNFPTSGAINEMSSQIIHGHILPNAFRLIGYKLQWKDGWGDFDTDKAQ